MASDQPYEHMSPTRPTGDFQSPPSVGQRQLHELLDASLVLAEDWEQLPESAILHMVQETDSRKLLQDLVQHRLLTDYQRSRVQSGNSFGLVLGNYRVLDRLGAGGMGIIFKAEHVRMRRIVAIKVLTVPRDPNPRSLLRFFAEMRAVAQLDHPHIVRALDAGQAVPPDPEAPVMHYLVLEYVPGKNLEAYVVENGALSIAQACELAYQVASALAEAEKQHLIHRDIKPSNIIRTPEGKAKLLDFGLVHHFRNRLTEPRTAIGTIDYMPPEQANDASAVDIRADIYSLGATLFWCLTGKTPFPELSSLTQELLHRQTQAPPSVRPLRPDVPAALEMVIQRMMATKPDDRYPSPLAVMRTLLPFCRRDSCDDLSRPVASRTATTPASASPAHIHDVLIVDDEADIRDICRLVLQSEGIHCEQAENGLRALEEVNARDYDLILLDIDMPVMSGREVLKRLRAFPSTPHLKIIMFSGRASGDELAEIMLAGADDYLTKPFSVTQLQARIKTALRLKDAQDRSDLLHRNMLAINGELEKNLGARDSDFVHARNALTLALARLVQHRDIESEGHVKRMPAYCRCLAQEAAKMPGFANQIDPSFIQMLECCAPLHDIGKVALPDHILLKPGALDPEERMIMQSHTTLGAETLEEVARQHGSALAFLHMAVDIVRHHHERYDGQGYPDRLAGSDIPLAARIVAIADTYDGLCSRRVGRPALSHSAALQVLRETSAGQFDPLLLQAFNRCADEFAQVLHQLPD